MSDCTHDLSERETAVADGYCPMCLVETIEQLEADKERLTNALYAGLVAFENIGLKLTANYLQMKDALAPPEEKYLNAD